MNVAGVVSHCPFVSHEKESRVKVKTYLSIRNLCVREEGGTMVEYGLMLALIAVIALVAVTLLGINISHLTRLHG